MKYRIIRLDDDHIAFGPRIDHHREIYFLKIDGGGSLAVLKVDPTVYHINPSSSSSDERLGDNG